MPCAHPAAHDQRPCSGDLQVREGSGAPTHDDVLSLLPEDLQPYLHTWRSSMLYQRFPLLDETKAHGGRWGDGPPLLYLPIMHFLNSLQQYRFAWVLEADVRYTGHWGQFLDAALHHAARHGRHPGADTAQCDGIHPCPQPDLVTLFPVQEHTMKWADTMQRMTPPFASSLLMAYGGSKRLFETLHNLTQAGMAGYFETFVPSAAVQAGLVTAVVQHRLYDGHTFHCCTSGAKHFYERWYVHPQQCAPAALLHPVKLRHSMWQTALRV